MTQIKLFEYAQIGQIDRAFIQDRTAEIKTLVKRTAEDIIQIGLKLIEVKERLPHGRWGEWLDCEFGWTDRMARRMINVANRFKSDNLSDLTFAQSALYLLAAPSTPDEAIDEAISRATHGEAITHKTAKAIVNNHKERVAGALADHPWQPPIPEDDQKEREPVEIETGARQLDQVERMIDVDDSPTEKNGRPYNYKRDERVSRPTDIYQPKGYDACQTPAYAIDPMLPFLHPDFVIWEPAAGEHYLVEALYDSGFKTEQVIISDILTDQNFFEYTPDCHWDCLITNPPYSIKYQWLERCYQLGRPFALLVPVEVLGTKTAQQLLREYGFEMMLLDKRVDFKMPNKGWDSSAQFPVFWLCWQMLPQQVMFGELHKNG